MITDRDELLTYYQRELLYFRDAGADFARAYPRIASRLRLGPEGTQDPHVERLIEAFAYLTARVQRSIDADFPRLTDALLGLLHPQLAAPVPAMAIASFRTETPPPTGAVLPRGLAVAATTGDDLRCRFRTCYQTTLWPLTLDQPEHLATGHWDFLDREPASSAIQLTLRGPPLTFAALGGQALRLYLGGPTGAVHRLADALLGACERVVFLTADGQKIILPAREVLRQAGFADDEAVLPDTPQGHPAYRLLREYFMFPEKFRFFDLLIPPVARLPGLGETETLRVLFLLPDSPRGGFALSRDSFQTGCTPVANLFPHVADPIRLDYRRAEYRVTPDARLARVMEVHSITGVHANAAAGEPRIEYMPYFSVNHATETDPPRGFWLTRRLPTGRPDSPGADTWISFVDLSLRPTSPDAQTVLVHTLCTNRLLPEQLPAGAALEPEQPASGARGVLITAPTPPRPAPSAGETPWRLVSQLSLNYLSLTDGPAALEALREILRLHAPALDAASEQQIMGLRELHCRPVVRRIGEGARMAPVRGIAIDLRVDERHFAGGSALLFASVLERFFALYVSLNTFTELALGSVQRRGVWHQWRPRPGEAIRA
jgi:type VI secretion system protein ImpG